LQCLAFFKRGTVAPEANDGFSGRIFQAFENDEALASERYQPSPPRRLRHWPSSGPDLRETRYDDTRFTEKDVATAFKRIDSDKNRAIGKQDLRKILRNLHEEATEEEVREMLAIADFSGSGNVSADDFRRLIYCGLMGFSKNQFDRLPAVSPPSDTNPKKTDSPSNQPTITHPHRSSSSSSASRNLASQRSERKHTNAAKPQTERLHVYDISSDSSDSQYNETSHRDHDTNDKTLARSSTIARLPPLDKRANVLTPLDVNPAQKLSRLNNIDIELAALHPLTNRYPAYQDMDDGDDGDDDDDDADDEEDGYDGDVEDLDEEEMADEDEEEEDVGPRIGEA